MFSLNGMSEIFKVHSFFDILLSSLLYRALILNCNRQTNSWNVSENIYYRLINNQNVLTNHVRIWRPQTLIGVRMEEFVYVRYLESIDHLKLFYEQHVPRKLRQSLRVKFMKRLDLIDAELHQHQLIPPQSTEPVPGSSHLLMFLTPRSTLWLLSSTSDEVFTAVHEPGNAGVLQVVFAYWNGLVIPLEYARTPSRFLVVVFNEEQLLVRVSTVLWSRGAGWIRFECRPPFGAPQAGRWSERLGESRRRAVDLVDIGRQSNRKTVTIHRIRHILSVDDWSFIYQ